VKKALIVIFLVLFFDQFIKIWIKTHMMIGEEYHVAGNWFIIHFTENNGMAFGMEFGGNWGKLFLSSFRILAILGLGYYLITLTKKNEPTTYIISIALIFAGAFGNIIDSTFYGRIFSESYSDIATFMPKEGGYAGLLHGKVVDMFYFPLIESHYPSWFPFWGGEEFIFFRPVFNLADASITAGVTLIILNQRKFFKEKETTVVQNQEAGTAIYREESSETNEQAS
jgi:signal peptidase II